MEMSIGELARQTGVKIPTIRYYEQIGLLPAPARTEGRQRRYGKNHQQRLKFIRHARDLSFEVGDIRQLLDLSETPQRSCSDIDHIASRQIERIEQQIARLDALRAELLRMVGECSHGQIGECRIVEVIGDHHLCAHSSH